MIGDGRLFKDRCICQTLQRQTTSQAVKGKKPAGMDTGGLFVRIIFPVSWGSSRRGSLAGSSVRHPDVGCHVSV